MENGIRRRRRNMENEKKRTKGVGIQIKAFLLRPPPAGKAEGMRRLGGERLLNGG